MSIQFWLLDINSEIRNGSPEVWLWGIDDTNRRVLLIDRSFLPYFYAVVSPSENPEQVLERIRDLGKEFPLIRDLELLDRKFFGKQVKVIKVTCTDPDSIVTYSKKLKRVPGVENCLEDSIRYIMRYLIDKEVRPCRWHQADVEEIEDISGIIADNIYVIRSALKYIERAELPAFRVLGFAMIEYSRTGTPKPEKDPIVILSASTNKGNGIQILADKDENAIMQGFISYVKENDPDVIVGYGTNQRDWPYLLTRARKLGLRLSLGRVNGEPHTSMYGHISITGRANVDLSDFSDELTSVKIRTLENVADALNVFRLKDRTIIEETDLAEYWEDSKKRIALKKYSLENLSSIMGLANPTMEYATELSALVGLPLDNIGVTAAGFRVEWVLIREAQHFGELVPEHREYPYFTYEGGMVLKPKPGVHENVAALDFKSMYPNIMISKNISPDTYLDPKEGDYQGAFTVTPEVGHRFRSEPPGFYKEVLTRLIRVRDDIREKLKTLSKDSVEYRLFDARQRAVKVITNATYGYAGWLGARWYVKPVAEATAAWGRYSIRSTIELADKLGLDVIYGDTDSIFVSHDSMKVGLLSKRVREQLGLEIKPDKIYIRILFTEAKKRYCGLFPDGHLDIVGLEVIRGDWAEVAKNVQEGVLGILLREQSPEKAVDYVQRYVSELLSRRVAFKDLIIWKTLAKPVGEYAVKAAHVEVAKMLMKQGWSFTLGDKIGYVVTVGRGKLYEKARPHSMVSYDEVDLDYYVENQILPAALRILEQFGVSKDSLTKPLQNREA